MTELDRLQVRLDKRLGQRDAPKALGAFVSTPMEPSEEAMMLELAPVLVMAAAFVCPKKQMP